ncbi:type II secretion system F family protein [Solwaraspora sp. WMMD1047]|uniref:type II secretion system F family protein n=1 Tax=Solwaraspora sp. WMMD1047 TaxID=3016102 RepID=UPI002416FE96|nr:type II secretion system F family protein [Solwaraspora sp. WMMD1047]MDG4833008.1 type II secretion system F family protein [Solwaraspora sp. WMMD1047]
MTPAWLALVTVVGAGFGLGLFLTVHELLPASPALGPALARLQPQPGEVPGRRTAWQRLTSRAHPIVPATDLRLLGRTPEEFVTSLAVVTLIGLALPSTLLGLLALIGRGFGPGVPVIAALICAAFLVALLYRDVASKAAEARRECRRAVCLFIDLAALQRAAGRGTEESLRRAASKGSGWVFTRIRQALLRAELEVTPPWTGLHRLGADMGVPELGDLGDIMQSAGVSGAQVYRTLRARAASLRGQIRADELARAELRTSQLEIPGALLLIVLMLLALYPFLARLLAGPQVN